MCHLFPVWLNNTSLVQSITWSDTAICLCCHFNCSGSVHGNRRVLLFCRRHLRLPRGSRLLLPEMTARTFTMSSRVRAGRYHHKHVHHSTTTTTTTIAPTEPGGGCRRSPESIKITIIHLLRSCDDGLPQSNTTSSSFLLHRSDELAVMDGRERVDAEVYG